MQNWSKSKRTFWQLIRIKATKRILQFADRVEHPKLKLLEYLKLHAEYNLYPRDCDLIACPSKLEVELDEVGFSDLFFPEDFLKLQQGLNKLLSNHSLSLGPDKERLNEWFNNIYNSGSGSASSVNVGSFSFGKRNDRSLSLLQNANIHLKYIAPSFIVLSILVKPSHEFTEKFTTLLKSSPCPQNEILSFNFKHGITSLSTLPPWRTRRAELEEIFLEINRSIVLLFRKNFGVGLSYFGPLPCIEVIKTNVSLREIPKDQYLPKTSKEFRACCKFFESLGYPFNLNPVYSDSDWWQFYEVNRDEAFYKKSHSYQILISLADYERSKREFDKNYWKSASGELSYKLHDLLSLLALEHFYEVLEDMIIDLKTELDPFLSRQIRGEISLKRLKSATSKMVRINGFYFQQSRIWVGIDEKLFLNYVYGEATAISRSKYHDNDSGLLRDDIKCRIDRIRKFCEDQLNLMRLSYEQILSYKTTIFNYRLSIVVALLTIVTVIPENIREDLISKVWVWLNSL